MERLRQKKSYFLAALILVLVVSVGLNLYDNFYTKPTMQTRMNYMSTEAFQSWLAEIKSIKSILEPAKTNIDVREAMNYTMRALRFATILEWQIEISRPPNFEEHLYLRMSGASYMLDRAVSAIATKPPITSRDLDNLTLQRIANLTATIENIVNSVGTVEDGIDPFQQLQEKGVLNQVISYAKQMKETSTQIWVTYGYYG